MSTTTDETEATTREWIDEVLVHGRQFCTLSGPLPFDTDGFHWRAGTTSVKRAVNAGGHMASGVDDDEIVARGIVADVEVAPEGDAAVLHVMPPSGGEHEGERTEEIIVGGTA